MMDIYNHVKHCTTHPKFLHSNSTSHRWVFGAIAELIDNAIDPDVSASQFCIDMKEFNGEPCLVFMDNGCGLVPEKLHKMLSFGHSKKQMTPGDRSIGKHGNGFKSGTMRLGKDVLVLTKCAYSMTAGFLSQTFLADTGAEDILIPQVSWDLNGNRLAPMDLEVEESLRAICKFSIFPDEDSLLAQLEAIPVTGAILIISNLRRHEGILELDFETDPHDIRITSEISASSFQQLRPNQPNTTEVPMDYSLRAYVSILYKVPRMQIFIRDKKVKTKRISGILNQKEIESYRPYGVAESITIELGFNTENRSLYGMMLYHRNRLIKAYMRVGMQLEENERGMGVIGLAEADFLQPTHNKQDFDDTTAYRRLLKKLSDVLAEYWWEKRERVHGPHLQLEPRTFRRGINISTSEDVPDVIWVQCDNPTCLKWRILPPGTDVSALPDIWYCEYHPDERFRNHEEPEQEWDPSTHEIYERRKERKREYDREKKEREAERKRQRLEAATKDYPEALHRQREAQTKDLHVQEAQGELAQKEAKLLGEQLRKMSEEYAVALARTGQEYAAALARNDEVTKQNSELQKQLELAKAELHRKDKEKEAAALRYAQQVQSEREARLGSLALNSLANGHVAEEEQNEPAARSFGNNTEGDKFRKFKGPQEREKRGRPRGRMPHGPPLLPATHLPLSSSPHVHRLPIESNGVVHGPEGNGGPPPNALGNSNLAAAPPSRTPMQRPREVQASQPPLHSAQNSVVALSKDFTSQGTSSAPQRIQQKGTTLFSAMGHIAGIHGATLEQRRRQANAGAGLLPPTSQPAIIDLTLSHDDHLPSQAPPQMRGRPLLPSREAPPAAAAAVAHIPPTPPTPSPACLPSFIPPPATTTPTPPVHLHGPNPALPTAPAPAPGPGPGPGHSSQVGPTTALEHRSALPADPAHRDRLSPPVAANGGASFDHRHEDLFTEEEEEEEEEGVRGSPGSRQFRDMGNGHHVDVDIEAPSSGLRLARPQVHNNTMSVGSGMLSVHLPMDSMVSSTNSRSEAEMTLDRAVYSLQRHLRLTLNTLLKLGGSEGLIELDGLPRQDTEVVSICEKANQHVETMMQTGRRESGKLKAELAYLMADKTQHGPSRNFKIQSIANKWGIGMEVSKQG